MAITTTTTTKKTDSLHESPRNRRLSARDVTKDDLAFGKAPVVIVPDRAEEHSETRMANGIATAMDHARQELAGLTVAEYAADLPAQTRTTGEYAFAFDIDGVLIKGGKVIPEAVEAMKMLNGHNSHGIKV